MFQLIHFRGHPVWVKRDDLYSLSEHSDAFCGNKARKLYHYLHNDFPGIERVVSYGSAQSNALYSLAVLCQLKGWQLEYYVDHIAASLADSPRGNFAAACDLGVDFRVIGDLDDGTVQQYVEQRVLPGRHNVLYIPEGVRTAAAQPGINMLAAEIERWQAAQGIDQLEVMLPSGTGTGALFLQQQLSATVLTCACVGGDDYLRAQFEELSTDRTSWPQLLAADKKYHFGKLYRQHFYLWRELLDESGIEFDLLYDPLGWHCLLQHLKRRTGNVPVLYIHQGGLKGNESMLPRYQRSLAGKSSAVKGFI